MRNRLRNHRAEYRRRIEKGLAAGKSRAAARGHSRAADRPKPVWGTINRDDPLEKALALMRRQLSQRAAAKAVGVTEERLRRHRLQATTSKRERGRWVIFDLRGQGFNIVSNGKLMAVTLTKDDGTEVSRYMTALNAFLDTNDDEHLHPFEGEGVTDVRGRFHKFETRPGVLRKLDSIGELSFLEIYADVT
jgi:hypothetical protein